MAEMRALSCTEIGARIARIRRQQKMTQRQLADKIYYEDCTVISRIEHGKRETLSVDMLQRIAAALQVTMNDLCYEATNTHPETNEDQPVDVKEAMSIFLKIDPGDRDTVLRMLRGLVK